MLRINPNLNVQYIGFTPRNGTEVRKRTQKEIKTMDLRKLHDVPDRRCKFCGASLPRLQHSDKLLIQAIIKETHSDECERCYNLGAILKDMPYNAFNRVAESVGFPKIQATNNVQSKTPQIVTRRFSSPTPNFEEVDND